MTKREPKPPTFKDYLQAFSDYLRRPKTVFDVKRPHKGNFIAYCDNNSAAEGCTNAE